MDEIQISLLFVSREHKLSFCWNRLLKDSATIVTKKITCQGPDAMLIGNDTTTP